MTADTDKPDTDNGEALKALERFVVENDDLLALESRIGRFNIFDALGITRAEIRHSNFLAFILDPAESHGQGQLLLKAILMDLLKKTAEDLRPISPIVLDGTDLRGVEVRREWNNIDLLITSKEPRFAVVIENKVGSQEHSNQLSRYQRTMMDHYPDLPALYVYLTPDGEEPSEDSWSPYSYRDIHGVLKRIRDTYQNSIGDEVLVFIDHYLNLLGTRFMTDDKLDRLCRQIYKNHRQALDLIWARVGTPEATELSEVVAILEHDTRWEVLYRSSRYVDILPNGWREWLPWSDPGESYPFCVTIRARDTELGYTMFIGPMDDAEQRREIVTKLREESSNLGFKPTRASEVAGKWARISAVETILKWGEDDEPEPEMIRESVKKKLDELYPKLGKLALVIKPLV
jgi:hypothetical protein